MQSDDHFLEPLSGADGLLLVHPEFYAYPGLRAPEGIERVYDKFRQAQRYCQERDIPFMVALSCYENMKRFSPIGTLGLQAGYSRFYIDDKDFVHTISGYVNKPAAHISLAFGGFGAGACVRDWVENLCADYSFAPDDPKTELPFTPRPFWTKPERIGHGAICYALTDRILDPAYDPARVNRLVNVNLRGESLKTMQSPRER